MRVLIVEDEILIAMELENIVTALGHQVVGAALDSRAAVALAEQHAPDLAFVDVHLLDGPTGIDAARTIIAKSRAMVVFTTANARRVDEDFAGACGVVQKPYSEAGIRATIAYLADCLAAGRTSASVPGALRLAPEFRERWRAV